MTDFPIFSALQEGLPGGGERSNPTSRSRRRACYFAIWATASSKSCWIGAGPAMKRVHSSRGVAFGDFDNDGDMDMLIMNMNEPPSLLRNDVSGGHWLKVLLEGVEIESQRDRRAVIAAYRRASHRLRP